MNDVFAIDGAGAGDFLAESSSAEMDFSIKVGRDILLDALKTISGVVDSSQVLQILSHIKLTAIDDTLHLVATDSEVEMSCSVPMLEKVHAKATVAVPGRKLLDICRSLPSSSAVNLAVESGWAKIIGSGNIEFTLAILPIDGFPVIDIHQESKVFKICESDLSDLLQASSFAMAQHDVRHFLNGMMMSFSASSLKAIATDGHRLAIDAANLIEGGSGEDKALVPRKAILELARLLDSRDSEVVITLAPQHISFATERFSLSTCLLEGSYPDCSKLIPSLDGAKAVVAKSEFKSALGRAAVLAKEKHHGVRLSFAAGSMQISSHNSDNEKTHEVVSISYSAEDMIIAFNIAYLADVMNVIKSEQVEFILSGAQNSILIKCGNESEALYVVMPMTI
jgi:DNA polymerase-3 subunit beta